MKMGIIGLGYWGKNIFKVLSERKDHSLILCDPFLDDFNKNIYEGYEFVDNYEELDCDAVFVIVPSVKHFEICSHFLSKGVDVFCEKPLCFSVDEVSTLYNLAKKNQCRLLVDWICTFTTELNFIKRDYDNGRLGRIKSVLSRRLALGPIRDDTDAKWDLASHDVSILCYLFNDYPREVFWRCGKRNSNSLQNDSCSAIFCYDDFYAMLDSSWEFLLGKNREIVFEFDKALVQWDDGKKTIKYNGSVVAKNLPGLSPLEKSIDTFLKGEKDFLESQEKLTLDVTAILNEHKV